MNGQSTEDLGASQPYTPQYIWGIDLITSSNRPLSPLPFGRLVSAILPDQTINLVVPVDHPTARSAVQVGGCWGACPDRTYRSARHSLPGEHARCTVASGLYVRDPGSRLHRRRRVRTRRRTETWRVKDHARHIAASCLCFRDLDLQRGSRIRRRTEILAERGAIGLVASSC